MTKEKITLEECKNIVAKQYNYSCWAAVKNKYRKDQFNVSDLIAFCDAANKMYYEQFESENESLKAALTEIISMKIHAVDNAYMYAFNKCYHIADKALESHPH